MREENDLQRTILPIPDPRRTAVVTFDAKDPDIKFPPMAQHRPPKGALRWDVSPNPDSTQESDNK
jgi:arylsulfatase